MFHPFIYTIIFVVANNVHPTCILAPLALRAAKMAVSRADQVPLETGLDFERACYAPLLRSKDRDEALEAFKEKRKPKFVGQ